MVSAVSSNATSSAYHTAVTSARRSAFSQAQHNDPTTARNGSSSQQPSFATTAARLAAVGGYSAHNAPRIPSYNHSSSPSIASSSSSYASSASGSERSVSPPHSRSSGERFTRSGSEPVSSPDSSSRRNTSAGWIGSANVNARNPTNTTMYGENLSRPSSSSSSVAPTMAWRSASVARTTSQSGLSGSESDARNTDGTRQHGALSSGRSQTSIDSDGQNPFAVTAAHPQPNVYLRRDPLSPPIRDTSGWETAFRSNTAEGRRQAKDQEDLVAAIDALGLDRNLNERRLPSTLSPPPPPSDGAWSFKKHITHAPPRGGLVEPEQLRGPSQEYLETVKQGSEYHHPSSNYYKGRRPKLLVLDVNNTLVARKKATSQAAKNATPRPFLSAFLEYICGSEEVVPGVFARRFNVMIWSSAEGDNVRTMCENMGLVSNLGEEAPLLLDMWDRSSMDLTAEQYNSKYPTIKDLTKLWTNKAIRWTPDGLHTLPKPSNGTTPATQATSAVDDAAATQPSPSPSPAPSSSSASSAASAGSNAQETPAAPALKKKDLKWSQLDTVLIDDSPSKACLQPHNHLAITSWKPLNRPPKSPAPHVFNSSPGNNSIEGSAPDTCLLQLVGILDDLQNYSNVSATINSNRYEDLGRGDMQHAWRDKGIEILKDLDIKVKQDFDPLWAVRALRRTNHFTSQSNGAIPSAASGSPGTRRPPVGWE